MIRAAVQEAIQVIPMVGRITKKHIVLNTIQGGIVIERIDLIRRVNSGQAQIADGVLQNVCQVECEDGKVHVVTESPNKIKRMMGLK